MPPRIPADEEIEGEIENQEDDDAGLLDDEGGDEAETGQESENVEAQEGQVEEDGRPKGRATKAVLEAKRIAREAAAETARVRQELESLRAERERERNRQQVESPEQEAARLALMTVEERVDYKLRKSEEKHTRELAAATFAAADAADKAAFEAKGAYDPRYKKYAPDVERLILQERQAGRNFPRDTILKFVLGEKVLANQAKVDAQRARGRENIRRQTTQPPSGRSDRAPARQRAGRGDTLADLEARLDGVQI